MSASYPGLPSPVFVACTNTSSNKRWGGFEARVHLPTYICQAGDRGGLIPLILYKITSHLSVVAKYSVCWFHGVTTTDRLHCTTRGCLGQPVKGAQLGLPGIVGTVTINENGLTQRGS